MISAAARKVYILRSSLRFWIESSVPILRYIHNFATMQAQLDPIFQAAIDRQSVPGAAAVALDASGKVLFSKGYGNTTFDNASSPKVTPDTPCMIWSCTKLFTSVAALQLLEKGKLDLYVSAETYVPELKKVQRLDGFDEEGNPILKPAEKQITVLNLITHTGGFSYDFFDPSTMRYRIAMGQPPVSYVTRSSMEEYTTPLIFEPGTRWEYGCNIDWLGFIVERLSGLTLADYIKQNIADPLGLKATGATLSESQDKAFHNVHTKDAEGKLTVTPLRFPPPDAEVKYPGGHFLYGSAQDYAQFLLTLMNNGTHPTSGVTILKPETVKKYVFADMIPAIGCPPDGLGAIPSTVGAVTCTGTMLPDVKKGWSCGLLLNLEDLPNGRKKGSGAWAGLGNCYYWVDPSAGKLGVVTSAVLPFFDKDVLHLFDALERAVYGKPMADAVGAKGSNFEGGNYKVN